LIRQGRRGAGARSSRLPYREPGPTSSTARGGKRNSKIRPAHPLSASYARLQAMILAGDLGSRKETRRIIMQILLGLRRAGASSNGDEAMWHRSASVAPGRQKPQSGPCRPPPCNLSRTGRSTPRSARMNGNTTDNQQRRTKPPARFCRPGGGPSPVWIEDLCPFIQREGPASDSFGRIEVWKLRFRW